jgi:hypothetical protein|tara:strand:- start:527 stop:709 length:183 start_codon:yes stop_codon:yes gene_type:complete
MEIIKMKTCYLTKKQTKFLIDFLDDGLHRELEIRREQDMDMANFEARKLLPKIINKLQGK